MTKQNNSLQELNDILFSQLRRLDDQKLKGEKLNEEVERTKAMGTIAKSVIDNGKLALDAEKFRDDRWNADAKLPDMLIGDEDESKK